MQRWDNVVIYTYLAYSTRYQVKGIYLYFRELFPGFHYLHVLFQTDYGIKVCQPQLEARMTDISAYATLTQSLMHVIESTYCIEQHALKCAITDTNCRWSSKNSLVPMSAQLRLTVWISG
jgi:hypothetical protein